MTKRRPGPVMLDVVGLTLSEDDIRRIDHPLTGGVILFARNFDDRAQLCSLTKQIRDVRDDILIAVDHEGGRVQRFRTDGFTHLPAMGKLGKLWHEDVFKATRVTTAVGYVLASELRACDIDLSFTPVLDLDYGTSAVIGDRAFDADPRVVAMLAKSLNHGLLLAGMANCGKHFPGHGFVAADSHHEIPVDERSLDEILSVDAQPYDWLGMSLAAVMPAHVIYPQVDPNPAGFSTKWLKEILRGQYGFDGVIFSDDLSMQGASAAGDVVTAAHAALDAGCDMVLICNSPEKADRLLHEMKPVADTVSQRRIKHLLGRGKVHGWEKMLAQPEYQAAKRLIAQTFGG
ncbi:beta-hexosaminidase [Pandoraea anapnoica]|uniref:Beta-hexosaminidase n=1 Tax=Pandoraea anapnoica TaxID=2508301 RepID=A0A5E4ZTK7_9BURK|nr:beta-N-acetylhexosaminidase [Pandoraea anapnoica]VVE64127.1 beta-hexosaminidase [Pandoraea anapnoica]